MKKLSLFIFAVFIMATGCFAQTESQNISRIISSFSDRGQNEYRYVPNEAAYAAYDDNVLVNYRDFYTYDEYEWYLVDKLTEKNINGTWMNYEQSSYSYNFAGSVETILHTEMVNGVMTNDSQETYTYDDMGLTLQEILIEDWENGSWVSTEKHIYTYGTPFTIIIKEKVGNQWENKNMYSFSSNGNTDIILFQDWQMGAWVNNTNYTKTFDNNENLVSMLVEEWINGAWGNDEMFTYTYQNGACSSILVEDWVNGAWANEYQFTYESQFGNAISSVCVEWENNAWVDANGDIVLPYNYFEDMLEYDDCHQVNMIYYDLYQVGLEEQNPARNSVYPNPAVDYFFVEGDDVQSVTVYNMNGQLVMQKNMASAKESFSTKGMSSGAYLIKVISDNGEVETHRIVKK